MRIEILTFEGCPNASAAAEAVRNAMQLESADATIVHVDVSTLEIALRLRFLGSPSVRVNGTDVEPAARKRAEYGLMCRTYNDGPNAIGIPPVAMIRELIRKEMKGVLG